MPLYTIHENFHIQLYGISGIAENKDWGATGMRLMNKMWPEVKSRNMPNKGLNVWVYEEGNKMFTGVELTAPPPKDTILEPKEVNLPKYVYYKHIGPYDKLQEAGATIAAQLKQDGIRTGLPYLEIYGHWTEDPSKLETEMLWSIQP